MCRLIKRLLIFKMGLMKLIAELLVRGSLPGALKALEGGE